MLSRRDIAPGVVVLFAVSVALMLHTSAALAQTGLGDDDAEHDGGADADGADEISDDAFDFGDDLAVNADEDQGDTQEIESPSPLSMRGFSRTRWGLWTERRGENGLAVGRTSVDIVARYKQPRVQLMASAHGAYDAAYLYQREKHDESTRAAYEWLIEPRELHALFSFDAVDLTVGRQIVPWGQADLVSWLDVINPRDLREPGLMDAGDVRLPVLGTRLGLFSKGYRLELMLINEATFGRRPPPLGTFSPLPAMLPASPPNDVRYSHRDEGFALESQQVAMRWEYAGRGLDVGFYLASVLDQEGTLVSPNLERLFTPTDETVFLELDHFRYHIVGHAGARPLGPWVLKWELGAEVERPVSINVSTPEMFGIATRRADLLRGVVGATYTAANTTLMVELRLSAYASAPPDVLLPYDATILAVRATHRRIRNTMQVAATGFAFGANLEHGWLARIELTYSVIESMKLTYGFASYHPGVELGPITGFERNDQAFAQLRWDFDLTPE